MWALNVQGTSAEVFLHGAHVTSWKAASGEVRNPGSHALLFTTRTSQCTFIKSMPWCAGDLVR